MSDVKQQIRDYVMEFITYGDPIEDDTSIIRDGLTDSTGAMEMILFLEETFGIIVDDEDVDPDNFDTIDIVTTFVENKQRMAA